MRRTRFPRATVVCVLLMAGCATERPVTTELHVSDSAGVRIAVSPPPPEATSGWRVDPEPALTLGVAEGDAAFQFNRIIGVIRAEDGAIIVADGGSGEIRWFNADGTHRFTAGGRGDGPGEFQFLRSIAPLPDGGVLAVDASDARVTGLSPDGEPRWSWRPRAEGAFPPLPGFALPGGEYLALGESQPEAWVPGYLHHASEQIVYLYEDRESPAIEIARLPGRDAYFEVDVQAVRNHHVPFGRSPRVVARGAGFYQGDGGSWEVRGYDLEGALTEVLRIDRQTHPVTPAAIRADREAFLALVRDPQQLDRFRTVYDNARIPERMPAWNDLVVDAEGYLWIRPYVPALGDQVLRWTVMRPDGLAVAEVTVPGGMHVHWIGTDVLLGTVADEFGVERIQVHRIDRP
jgi:hypothetical protein